MLLHVVCPPHRLVGGVLAFMAPSVRFGDMGATLRGLRAESPTDLTRRGLDTRPIRGMPTWMASPENPVLLSKFCCRRRWCSSTTILQMGGLGNRIATTVAMRGGMLVGGGGVSTMATPIGAIILVTASLSAVLEQRTKVGAVVGSPLLSFGTFCVLSNLGLVPSTHPVYDLCWSFLLPLSLSIIILGNPLVAKSNQNKSDSVLVEQVSSASMSSREPLGPIGRVGLSFVIGAFGSIVGVMASFRLVTTCRAWGGAIALPRQTAARIAGAVTATYVGGSVNLFAVAAAVGLIGATSAGEASLLGALAASDIFLMALYFSGLVAAHKTALLWRIFPTAASAVARSRASEVNSPDKLSGIEQKATSIGKMKRQGRSSLRSYATTTVSLFALGSVICSLSNAITNRSPVPGTATMVVTLLTVGVTRVLASLAPRFQARFSRIGPVLATLLLNVFFSSVGASGRWAQVVGVAPAIFVFASLALGVHVVVMATGVAALNRFCGTGLSIDDMIVASNANIGGPSTAATFAGLIGQDELVVPAAVWGTVGYAIATTLGVGVWATLR